MWERQKQGLPTRARQNLDSKLYDVYPTRELLEDEFNKIWNAQAEFYPDELTSERKVLFFNIIFHQRKLKSQPIGKCTYFQMENRAHRAMPSMQRYRIFQDVNNLEWRYDSDVERLLDYRPNRDLIVHLLENPSKKSKPTHKNALVGFSKIRTELKKRDASIDDSCIFNLESDRRKGLDGNQTSNVMQHEDFVGPEWHSWELDKQDKFISVILNDELGDDEVVEILEREYDLTPYAAENCKNATLVDGTANISIKAARVLTDFMEMKCIFSQMRLVGHL